MYLCDYEFLGESTSGLQLIEKLGIQNQSILITSRYEERTVRDYCNQLGVRLIPKGMAGFVPIEKVSNPIRPDAILIDDDSLVHSIWKASAIRNNKDLKLFSSAIDFEAKMNSFDRATPLYIDSNLGNGVKGEELAKKLFDQGFTSIYLATGYDPDQFIPMPWLRSIVGKNAIWDQNCST